MQAPRLSASVEAAGFLRRAEADGGFGAVLKKGDAERGSILLLVRSRGKFAACLERLPDLRGSYRWERTGPVPQESDDNVAQFVDKRTRFDPDLWVIELDIAQPERFIAETTFAG